MALLCRVVNPNRGMWPPRSAPSRVRIDDGGGLSDDEEVEGLFGDVGESLRSALTVGGGGGCGAK
jgi:hypothetical protein